MTGDYFATRTALVTGGARGIGRAIVRRLLAEGARVATCDVRERDLELLQAAAGDTPGRLACFTADVRDTEQVVAALDRIGWPVDILVNNAALAPRIPSLELSPAQFDLVLDVNVASAFRLARAMVERARGAELSIVNVASVNALTGQPEMAHYNASKAALLSLTRTLAVEWACLGVRVNAVCPGSTWTDAWEEGGWDAETKERLAAKNPLRRFARPEEIAGPVVFLAGPDATFVTGHGLVVDGGLTLAV
ncbi:SDR family NAD(P)-dependent oxidoreductase [Jiangella rhizosphaerae]|uniref:SDR family oxidoreductase n=1 Tax=Jiangella rhizosphaerae TaxID=2293569 RepID=A0A418KM16_9ACTN|nr:SDR family oxidoreductase [Jiangella rhizosphaerae]RIQ19000.1 SDR family oxidoreductase [Jiangella rhizosphaerae]